MEDVHSERIEQNRLRRCHIYYFLEDDSMMVVEPSVSNSGIPHGMFDKPEKSFLKMFFMDNFEPFLPIL